MDWIIQNWQFITSVASIIIFLTIIAVQTKRNAKDIARLDEEIKENKKESDRINEKLFNKLETMQKDIFNQMVTGFNSINDKLYGLAKDGGIRSNKGE